MCKTFIIFFDIASNTYCFCFQQKIMFKCFDCVRCRALDIRTKAYGPKHHDVGQTLMSYAAFLLHVDAKKSADAAKQAVEIFEVQFSRFSI